jgi:NitT/TauT family transport system permease protein
VSETKPTPAGGPADPAQAAAPRAVTCAPQPAKRKPSKLAKALFALVTPNADVAVPTYALLSALYVALAFLVWSQCATQVIPKPLEVLQALQDLWLNDGLGRELWTSMQLNLHALFIYTSLSLVLAYSSRWPFMRPIVMFIGQLRYLSPMGFVFLLTMYTHSSHQLKVALLVFFITPFFTKSMADVVMQIPEEQFDHARTLRMSELRVVWEVAVLGTAAVAFTVLWQMAAMGWSMLTMVEGISRAEGGVGALLLNQNKHFRLAQVFAIQFVILLIGLVVQDYCIRFMRRLVCPYASLGIERTK